MKLVNSGIPMADSRWGWQKTAKFCKAKSFNKKEKQKMKCRKKKKKREGEMKD